jgi:hypothetical protein
MADSDFTKGRAYWAAITSPDFTGLATSLPSTALSTI